MNLQECIQYKNDVTRVKINDEYAHSVLEWLIFHVEELQAENKKLKEAKEEEITLAECETCVDGMDLAILNGAQPTKYMLYVHKLMKWLVGEMKKKEKT